VAAGAESESDFHDLHVYQQGSGTAANTYDLGPPNLVVAPRGLAWSPDGSRLFAVLEDGLLGSSYSLQVIDYPLLTASSLSLSGPAPVQAGQSVTLTGSAPGHH
jgi:hypothetical protein